MMMRVSLSLCKETVSSLLDIPSGLLKSDFFCPTRHKEKVVILMGATGTGKSRLSIDLAIRFPAEVINSDKIQVHEGLDIVTNKITEEEQCGVPHHLLGVINPNADFTVTDFVDMASHAMDSIVSRSQLPIIAGGSNSFIEALVDDKHFRFQSRYECCFLWVDVAMPVLHQYVSDRVDKMVENGMVDEVRSFFDSNVNYSTGIGKAIGVPEFDRYFRAERFLDKRGRSKLLQEAIQEIKRNTCRLACRQWEKINRLRNQKNWKIHQLNATEAFRRHGGEADEAWEELVAGPSTEIVAEFVYDISSKALLTSPAGAIRVPCGIML
ncbi:Adenylate isopentenyltransferase 3 [Hibiscus syriacus]|uniref:adenylate dimethylallyltransferase (ADP/ATP-dependent) n=1 Tax=Hibiscus syriacus TaxID=106335 RepID=A0A6A2WLF1_HIBSY|nr:adenylate isopentenyltransferase 3, chloroplastic-like [Hibiscus syriacus]KAE8660643.1 Adenylate isopentenyltransferase 3 [Hibiscus syriacus]